MRLARHPRACLHRKYVGALDSQGEQLPAPLSGGTVVATVETPSDEPFRAGAAVRGPRGASLS
jgi:hypothetical protein